MREEREFPLWEECYCGSEKEKKINVQLYSLLNGCFWKPTILNAKKAPINIAMYNLKNV